ncbi:MAG: hypothetical protein ACR2FV_03150 [Ornithinimicrobium sp.]|uniref:hypothetical protein n=1 Tax=Ornithinimicrobium sp. TaxID=1977084 RepID=UPI003D9AE041
MAEGPKDSPAQGEPTTKSAVQPLPPGSDAEEVVDGIERRARSETAEVETDDADGVEVETDDADGGEDSSDAPD